MESLKKNYFYNLLINFTGMVIPVVTFPYVARVLGPENVGKVNFVSTIVDYFVVIFVAGIGPYIVRELSKLRDNKIEYNRRFTEAFIINSLLVLLILSSFITFVFTVEKFSSEKYLFLIIGLQILINLVAFDWVFMSYENYSYIATRVIVFRIIGVILLFLLVRKSEDYLIYGFITLFLTGWISHVVSIFFVGKYCSFDFSQIKLSVHILPIITALLLSFSTKLYVGLDVTLLGFLSSYQYVGYYVVGLKIVMIIQSLIYSLINATAPRISYYSSLNDVESIKEITKKSIEFTFLITTPAILGTIFLSREIILIFSGHEYLPSQITLLFMPITILITSLSMLLGTQYLYYTGREKKYIITIVISTVILVFLSILLIPRYYHIGAGIARSVSDLIHLILLMIVTKEVSIKSIFSTQNLKYLLAGGIMYLSLYLIDTLLVKTEDVLLRTIIFTSTGATIYIGINLITKDYFIISSIKMLTDVINKLRKS